MNFYRQGDWNAVCALCGTKYKASELIWNSQIQDWVCIYDWEQRHPQERVKAVQDDQSVPWVRPDPSPTYSTESGYIEADPTNVLDPFYVEFGYMV